MSKIKFCIWDVGGVLYPYTLSHLYEWAHYSRTKPAKEGPFDFNPYMKGEVFFDTFCRQFCEHQGVVFEFKHLKEIERFLKAGIGKNFQVSIDLMGTLKEQGIENCILSNALPILAGARTFEDVKREHVFCSFNLRLLKPDPKIYEKVREKLNCSFEEMAFIDDKTINVDAAIKLGIKGIPFNIQTISNEIKTLLATQA